MSNGGFPRGVAIQGYCFQLLDKNSGNPVTSGTVTVNIVKDGGAEAPATNPATHVTNGRWKITITAAERTAKITSVQITHATAVPFNVNFVSDDQLGPGSQEVVINYNSAAAFGDVWVVTQADPSTVIASGTLDSNGDITFYLDAGAYNVYVQKAGYNASNPLAITVV